MNVPLFSAQARNQALEESLQESFSRVLRSGQFILGDEVTAFEAELGRWMGGVEAVGVSSGTDALLCALMALEVGRGDEVIIPAFTFFSTAGVVARLGATPVFCDVCPACYQVTPEMMEAVRTSRTRAVIPVCLFGHCPDMEGIVNWAGEHEIAVVEDIAQALGARVGDVRAGTLGDFGCTSFFPTKNLGGMGDGGMIFTECTHRAERLRALRNHGMEPRYYHSRVGGNFRLDALQAALLRDKLPYLDGDLEARASHAHEVMDRLRTHPLVQVGCPSTCDCSGGGRKGSEAMISLPFIRPGQTPAWNLLTVRVHHGQRHCLREVLGKAKIGNEIYYPVPLHRQECLREVTVAGTLPHAELLADEVLSLPVYPELSREQLAWISDTLLGWLDRVSR